MSSFEQRSSMMSHLIFFVVVAAVAYTAQAKYQGCYEDKASDRDLGGYHTTMSYSSDVQTCISICTLQAYKYAGVQGGNNCYCGNSFGSHGLKPEDDCDIYCFGEFFSDSGARCGGQLRNSVYATKYMGCFKDSSTRALAVTAHQSALGSSNNVDDCIDLCSQSGYKYAGLQSSSECYCGDEYDFYGEAPASECQSTCGGNRDQKCGGIWRNSVYSTVEVDSAFSA